MQKSEKKYYYEKNPDFLRFFQFYRQAGESFDENPDQLMISLQCETSHSIRLHF